MFNATTTLDRDAALHTAWSLLKRIAKRVREAQEKADGNAGASPPTNGTAGELVKVPCTSASLILHDFAGAGKASPGNAGSVEAGDTNKNTPR